MSALVTAFSSFLLLSLLYARLTNGTHALLPVGYNPRVEAVVWWILFSIAAWTLGTGLWQLFDRVQTGWEVAIGAATAAICIASICWYAYHLDPGNEFKVFRTVLPQGLAIITVILAAVLAVDRKHVVRTTIPTGSYAPNVLEYWCSSQHYSNYARWLMCVVGAILSCGGGGLVLLLNRQIELFRKFNVGMQLFELLLIFVLPVALLEWASHVVRVRDRPLAHLSPRIAAIGLMGVAAFAI